MADKRKRFYPTTPKQQTLDSKSNNSNKNNNTNKNKPKQLTQKEKLQMQDTYVNVMSRIGAGSDNVASMGEYYSNYITRDYRLLDVLYRSNWVVRDVVNIVSEDMIKNWIDISSTRLDNDSVSKFNRYVNTIQLRTQIEQGLKWSRLYGGAIGIIILEGQEDQLDQPLDYDSILPDSFRRLLILDRWRGVSPSPQLVTDFNDPDYDTPMYYTITNPEISEITQVHHSRCIRFINTKLPYYEEIAEMWWGLSEVETIYDVLNCYDGTRENINALLYSANLKYIKTDFLMQRLATGNKEDEMRAQSQMRAMNQLMTSHSLQFLEKEDELGNLTYNFSGVDNVYQTFMLDLCAAVKIPMTRLFGRSEAGLNSNGEGDLQIYYDLINQKQNIHLKPVIDKLLPILCLSIFGYIPEDIDYEFKSIRQPTEDERREQARNGSKSAVEVYNTGGISKQMFLKALKNCGDIWDNVISDQDIEEAEDTPTQPDLQTELTNNLLEEIPINNE